MKWLTENWQELGLALARIVTGYMWYTQLLWKLPPSFGCPADFAVSTSLDNRTSGLCDWTGLIGVYSTVPLHRDLVHNLIAPNLQWFGWGVFLLEGFVFVSLTLGLLTRLGALLGLLEATNLYMGLVGLPFEWYWTYGMMIVLHWMLLVTAPGCVLGIDAIFYKVLKPRADQGSVLAKGLLWLL